LAPLDRLSKPHDGTDLLYSALQVGFDLIIGDTQDKIACHQEFIVAMTIVRELGIIPVIRSIQFHDDTALSPEQVNAWS
jgi:hypothetical protein